MSADDPVALWASAQVTHLLNGQPDPPEYGSPAWRALLADDPRRAAAIITAAELWRRYVGGDDLAAWLADATAPRPPLHEQPTGDELAAHRQHQPAREIQAADGWPPVAIPGRPGWWRHYANGRQEDRPHQTGAAAA